MHGCLKLPFFASIMCILLVFFGLVTRLSSSPWSPGQLCTQCIFLVPLKCTHFGFAHCVDYAFARGPSVHLLHGLVVVVGLVFGFGLYALALWVALVIGLFGLGSGQPRHSLVFAVIVP